MSNPRALLGDLSFRGGLLLGGYQASLISLSVELNNSSRMSSMAQYKNRLEIFSKRFIIYVWKGTLR